MKKKNHWSLKKNSLLISLTLISSLQSFSQKFSTEYGVISGSEIAMESYDKDLEAEAVVLFDIGDAFFERDDRYGYVITFTRTKRIKILSDAGIEFANIEVPYYREDRGDSEKIRSLVGRTYTPLPNGTYKVTELDPDQIYDEQKNKYYRVKKFAFPDVKKGSVVEFKYELISPFKFNLPDWEFQSKIPTVYSKYKVAMVPFYEYVYTLQGGPLDYQNSEVDRSTRTFAGIDYKDYIHTYVRRDIPAFKDESYITSIDDYLAKLDFQLAKIYSPRGGSTEILSTWPKLVKEYSDHQQFGKYIKKAQKISEKEIIQTLDLSEKTDLEKAKVITDYMKNNFTWDRYYAKYADQDVKDFLEKKEGNVADINLFTVGLLRAANIESSPVLISTRDHGKIHQGYPFSHYFNYVIILVKLGENYVVLDATNPKLPFDLLPPFCINEQGLIVDEDKVSWAQLGANTVSLKHYNIFMKPGTDGNNSALSISAFMTNYEGYLMSKQYLDSDEELQKNLEKKHNIRLDSTKVKVSDQRVSRYAMSATGTKDFTKIENTILVKPFLNFIEEKNPLSQSSRTYPIDFVYKKAESYKTIVTIPEGYELSYKPSDLEFSNQLMSVKYTSQQIDDQLILTGSISQNKDVYAAEEYEKLRGYFKLVIEKFNDHIVLEQL
ncbi:MAG: DUF3857 domain-containing protein [Marinoscillum sp.]